MRDDRVWNVLPIASVVADHRIRHATSLLARADKGTAMRTKPLTVTTQPATSANAVWTVRMEKP